MDYKTAQKTVLAEFYKEQLETKNIWYKAWLLLIVRQPSLNLAWNPSLKNTGIAILVS